MKSDACPSLHCSLSHRISHYIFQMNFNLEEVSLHLVLKKRGEIQDSRMTVSHMLHFYFYLQRQRRSTNDENCCCCSWDEVKLHAVFVVFLVP